MAAISSFTDENMFIALDNHPVFQTKKSEPFKARFFETYQHYNYEAGKAFYKHPTISDLRACAHTLPKPAVWGSLLDHPVTFSRARLPSNSNVALAQVQPATLAASSR
jgi:hypothetical protein